MLYGRSLGESFGLACAEFSILDKKIISYGFNRHRCHIFNLPKSNFKEYFSRKDLYNILNNFKKKDSINFNKDNKYLNYSAKKVMNKFNKVFLKSNSNIRLSLFDYLTNTISFIKINYLYIRHKIYNNYHRFFESKFIYYKD